MSKPLIADTGGLLRALAAAPDGSAAWPAYERALTDASVVVVPAPVLVEVDYFLRDNRAAMRRLVQDIFDAASSYQLEHLLAEDVVRALEIDAKFPQLKLGLVDGVIAAVAERRQITRVLTTDRRDMSTLRIGLRYRQSLELVP